MKKRIVSILAVTMVMFMASASAQYSSEKTPNSIDVNGYAELEVEPNLIYLDITINEETTKGKVSVEEMEITMAKSLKKAGINVEQQLTVKDMSSNLEELFLRKDQVRTSKSYSLKLHSVAELTSTVRALENVGISNMNVDRVSHSDLEMLRNKVRVLALKNAKEKATLLTEALEVKLGSVIYITDADRTYSNQSFRLSAYRNVQNDGSVSAKAPDLEFEKITINHNVGATFMFTK